MDTDRHSDMCSALNVTILGLIGRYGDTEDAISGLFHALECVEQALKQDYGPEPSTESQIREANAR